MDRPVPNSCGTAAAVLGTPEPCVTVMTWNVWKLGGELHWWEERRPGIEKVVSNFEPDVLCVQELSPQCRDAVDEVLQQKHRRIDDGFEGWVSESNIWYNATIFEEVEHGHEDIGNAQPDKVGAQHRRLFWARLRLQSGVTILVSTAHFTWQGDEDEKRDNVDRRRLQAKATVAQLERLAKCGEPVLFMGDLNCPFHVNEIMKTHGFVDCFSALGLRHGPTHPVRPSHPEEEALADQCLDWCYAGPCGPKAVLAAVLREIDTGIRVAASDHMPVLAVYRLPSATSCVL